MGFHPMDTMEELWRGGYVDVNAWSVQLEFLLFEKK
jgi:hypothetical protein